MENYKKYRWFYTSSGKLVVGGKNAAQNDLLLKKIKEGGEEHIIMHTSDPGSPFCIILAELSKITQADMHECAVFTGCFSRAWRTGKAQTTVDIFRLSQLHKDKTMKEGTWGVYGRVQHLTVPLELVVTRQYKVIRAIPEHSVKGKKQGVKICPGSIGKEDILPKLEIEMNEPLSKEEVLQALPAGGFRISRL